MYNEGYFRGNVNAVGCDLVKTTEIRRYGFLHLFSRETEKTEERHFALVKLFGFRDMLKIPITKEESEKIKIGGDTSLFLRFEYKFACWFLDAEKEDPILDVMQMLKEKVASTTYRQS